MRRHHLHRALALTAGGGEGAHAQTAPAQDRDAPLRAGQGESAAEALRG